MFPLFHWCCLCIDNVHLTSPFMFHNSTPFSCACICFSCNWISPIIVIFLRFSAWKPCFDSWPFELISISHQNLVQHVACPVVHLPRDVTAFLESTLCSDKTMFHNSYKLPECILFSCSFDQTTRSCKSIVSFFKL